MKSPHDSTTTKPQAHISWNYNKPNHLNEQLSETSRTKTNYSNNYCLRSKRKKASEQIPNTENDVTHNKTVLNHTINKAHLPISLSPSQQHLQNLHLSTPNKMSKSTKTPNFQASPSKSKFSISLFLIHLNHRLQKTNNIQRIKNWMTRYKGYSTWNWSQPWSTETLSYEKWETVSLLTTSKDAKDSANRFTANGGTSVPATFAYWLQINSRSHTSWKSHACNPPRCVGGWPKLANEYGVLSSTGIS